MKCRQYQGLCKEEKQPRIKKDIITNDKLERAGVKTQAHTPPFSSVWTFSETVWSSHNELCMWIDMELAASHPFPPFFSLSLFFQFSFSFTVPVERCNTNSPRDPRLKSLQSFCSVCSLTLFLQCTQKPRLSL